MLKCKQNCVYHTTLSTTNTTAVSKSPSLIDVQKCWTRGLFCITDCLTNDDVESNIISHNGVYKLLFPKTNYYLVNDGYFSSTKRHTIVLSIMFSLIFKLNNHRKLTQCSGKVFFIVIFKYNIWMLWDRLHIGILCFMWSLNLAIAYH